MFLNWVLVLQVLDDVSSAPRVTAQPDAAAAARRQEPQTAAGGDTNPAASQLDAEANGGAGAAAAADQAAAAPPADAAADEDQDEDREAGLRSRKNDIVAALNFSLCLLHTRELAVRYLHLAHAAMDSQGGSIMVRFLTNILDGRPLTDIVRMNTPQTHALLCPRAVSAGTHRRTLDFRRGA